MAGLPVVPKVKVFKIRNKDNGLYSGGGYDPGWSTIGESWDTLNALLLHLKLYRRGHPYDKKDTLRQGKKYHPRVIPKSWEIVMFEVKQCEVIKITADMLKLKKKK
jgi:hypothetical protein